MLCEEIKGNISNRYRLLIEHSPHGITLIGLDGYIVEVNKKTLEILGSPSEEATRDINMLSFPPLVEAGVSDVVKRSLCGEKVITGVIPYTTRWGKFVRFKFTAVPVFDEKDEVCFSMLLIEEWTEQEKAKEDLCRANKLLTAVIDGIGDLIWLKDTKGRYVKMNRAFEEFNAFVPGGAVNKTDHELWPKGLADRLVADDTRAVECGHPIVIEEFINHPTMGLRYYQTTKTPVSDLDGNVFGTVGIARDVTAEVERREIAKDAMLKLQASLSSNIFVK